MGQVHLTLLLVFRLRAIPQYLAGPIERSETDRHESRVKDDERPAVACRLEGIGVGVDADPVNGVDGFRCAYPSYGPPPMPALLRQYVCASHLPADPTRNSVCSCTAIHADRLMAAKLSRCRCPSLPVKSKP